MTFAQPTAPNEGDKFEPKLFDGRLLMVFPTAYSRQKTKYDIKPDDITDCMDTDAVIAVDGPSGPKVFHGARLFGNLAVTTKTAIGGVVLARLGQVPTSNGNPAWVLLPHTDADAAAAAPVHDAFRRGEFAQPVAPAAQPAVQSPWGAAAPPPQSWGQATGAAAWGNPPPTIPAAAPVTPAPAATPAVNPALVAFLASKGVTVTPGMSQAVCEQIAATFSAAPAPEPPF